MDLSMLRAAIAWAERVPTTGAGLLPEATEGTLHAVKEDSQRRAMLYEAEAQHRAVEALRQEELAIGLDLFTHNRGHRRGHVLAPAGLIEPRCLISVLEPSCIIRECLGTHVSSTPP